jgi:hypothetical protein
MNSMLTCPRRGRTWITPCKRSAARGRKEQLPSPELRSSSTPTASLYSHFPVYSKKNSASNVLLTINF